MNADLRNHLRQQVDEAARYRLGVKPEKRHEAALELRRQGLPYKRIGKRLGVAPSTVYGWLNK